MIATARAQSGTRCSRPLFIRDAGTVQTRDSRSTLALSGAEDLAGPASGQHQELQRQGRHALALLELEDEGRNGGEGHGREVAARQLAALGQEASPS